MIKEPKFMAGIFFSNTLTIFRSVQLIHYFRRHINKSLTFLILSASFQSKAQELNTNLKNANFFLIEAERTAYSNLDSCFYFSSKALKISNRILSTEPSNLEATRIKGNALVNVSYYYFETGNILIAKNKVFEGFRLLLKANDNSGLSSCSSNIAAYYESEGNTKQAEKYFNAALYYAKLARDSLGIADSYNSLAYLFNNTGEVIKGIEFFQQALRIQKQIGDVVGEANTLYNLGSVYLKQEEVESGVNNLKQAIKIFKSIGDKQAEANGYSTLAHAFLKSNDTSSFYSFTDKAIAIFIAIGDKKNLSDCYANKASQKISVKNYQEAEFLSKQSIQIAKEIGNKKVLALSYYHLSGITLLRDKNYSKAEELALESYDLTKEIGYIQNMANSCQRLYAIYVKKENYKKALEYLNLYHLWNDSIKNDQTQKAAIKNKFKIDFEVKEQTLKSKNEFEKAIIRKDSEDEKNKHRLIIYGVSFILLIVVFLLIFIFKNLRIHKRKNATIEIQKKHIEEKQKEVTDSIVYAKRLQEAILPPLSLIDKHLKNNFVFYLPKDIVAGDFYWMEIKGDNIFIAAADCTGHGVPGAMVSVVCSNALNRSVNEFDINDPAKILDKTRELVIETFSKSGDDVKDGMDISLCVLNKKTKEIKWAGANNPLWILSKGSIEEIKADKQPVGKHEKASPFSSHQFILSKEQTLYLFTDGYADQFGGENQKKFKHKHLKEILIQNEKLPLTEQKQLLYNAFCKWKGDLEQVDDICIIGIRL